MDNPIDIIVIESDLYDMEYVMEDIINLQIEIGHIPQSYINTFIKEN